MVPRKGCEQTTMRVRLVRSFAVIANNDFCGFDMLHLQVISGDVNGSEEEEDDDELDEGDVDTLESLGKVQILSLKSLRSTGPKARTWVCWSDGLHATARVKHLLNDAYKAPEAPKKVDPFSLIHYLLCVATERLCLLCRQAKGKRKVKGSAK